ncbi:MAG: hypothetical protein AAFQ51_09585 [Pseudomonadota bacterium]
MVVEIGSLVVRGSFGAPSPQKTDSDEMAEALAQMRQDILDEVEEMIAKAEQRRRER